MHLYIANYQDHIASKYLIISSRKYSIDLLILWNYFQCYLIRMERTLARIQLGDVYDPWHATCIGHNTKIKDMNRQNECLVS